MKSVMTHAFSQVPKADIPRSQFNRSCGYKTTFDAGYLIPFFVDEALPGDTFNLRLNAFARLATPLHPFMDNIRLKTYFFAVPIRLTWTNWERFNGAQDDPGDSTDFLIPQITSPAGGYLEGTIYDYMGLPTKIAGLSHSALWLRAYNLIWNEWFRDQNLQNSITVNKGDGPDASTDYVLKRRGKQHDYFTSCLPWPQKGEAVPLPLSGNAPVTGLWRSGTVDTLSSLWYNQDGTQWSAGGPQAYISAPSTSDYIAFEKDGSGSGMNVMADLSAVTAATINELRQAFQIQKLYERDARGGTRYTEIILSHFGVQSPDARLQRPEYLGGGTSYVNVTPIAQTSSTDETSPLGNLAAVGTSSIQGHGFTKSFTEHCIIIGLICAEADLTYQEGLDRMWSRRTRWDFYWPALSHIGEQAVLNKEIYAQGTSADDDVFGYQERYAEYRYKPSKITGLYRSNATGTLDSWHLADDFSTLPVLNGSFIEVNPPIDRVIAVPSQPHFLFDSFVDLKCARPMPVYSVPGLIDHF